jgi:hypothetical protein
LVGGLDFSPYIGSVIITYPSEKYDFVSWDDDIPNIWGKNPDHQPNNNMD